MKLKIGHLAEPLKFSCTMPNYVENLENIVRSYRFAYLLGCVLSSSVRKGTYMKEHHKFVPSRHSSLATSSAGSDCALLLRRFMV